MKVTTILAVKEKYEEELAEKGAFMLRNIFAKGLEEKEILEKEKAEEEELRKKARVSKPPIQLVLIKLTIDKLSINNLPKMRRQVAKYKEYNANLEKGSLPNVNRPVANLTTEEAQERSVANLTAEEAQERFDMITTLLRIGFKKETIVNLSLETLRRMVAKPKENREKKTQQKQQYKQLERLKRKTSEEERATWFKKHNVEAPKEHKRIVAAFELGIGIFLKEVLREKLGKIQVDLVVERGDQEEIRFYAPRELKWLNDEVLFALEKMKTLHQSKDNEDVKFCYKCIKEFTEMGRRKEVRSRRSDLSPMFEPFLSPISNSRFREITVNHSSLGYQAILLRFKIIKTGKQVFEGKFPNPKVFPKQNFVYRTNLPLEEVFNHDTNIGEVLVDVSYGEPRSRIQKSKLQTQDSNDGKEVDASESLPCGYR
ncbi:hypothetical protein L1987_46978 [Smallanthus sonchifolius]|uniref:Uncharacterized protein n=1 Tax=Smallanthus sonchifolius TaxID=185202 RepID=A0ACB9G134_9ASTR|nr:hypothetical protein L1987_46978 [Smallanthus sonchifolius]